MQANSEIDSFLVDLIDRLTPLNNNWRNARDPLTKIELMWEIGREISQAVKNSSFGFDNLLRTLYDPHGKKNTYITRDLGSYSHRIYLYFKSKEEIRVQLRGLKSYTLFREAFPLLTNEKYKLSDRRKTEVINTIINTKDSKKTQAELIKLKQAIRPIKNTRTSKSQQYSDEAKWLLEIRNEVVEYIKNNTEFNPKTFPVKVNEIDTFSMVIMALVNNRVLDKKIEPSTIENEKLRGIVKIANSTTEDKSRFKKWGIDTYKLMTLAEMLYSTKSQDKYNFVRQKLINS